MIPRTITGVAYFWLIFLANQIIPNKSGVAASSPLVRGRELPACGSDITIEASCKVDSDGSDCSMLHRHYWPCEQSVSEMTFRYNGGNCNQGYNSQPLKLFQCSDSVANEPPTTEEGKRRYIVVKDVNERGSRTYFSMYVIVGEDFLLVDMEVPGRILDEDLNVTIYSSKDIGPASLLQTFVFRTSCQHSLFLNDYFGSIQLVGFQNEKQGMVSNFASATLGFVVKNEGQSSVDISSFKLQTAEEIDNIYEADNGGQNVGIGGEMSIMKQVYFDVGISREFLVMAIVGIDNGSPCEVTQDLEIAIGTSLEETSAKDTIQLPTVTDAPSAAPITAMPIMENSEEHCNLVSSILCEVKNGPTTNCESLEAPIQAECQGGVTPKQLTFKYTGQTCAESDHDPNFRHRFVCVDETPGIENAMHVFVSVNDESPHAVPKNEEFSLVSNFGSYIHVTVYESDNGQPGAELQNTKIGTRCVEGDDLCLMKNYGAIQLLGFENESQGAVVSYVDVELTYMIENNGAGGANNLSAVAKCEGQNHELATGESIQPNQVKKYTQYERVNLVGSPQVRFQLEVTATSNGALCVDQNEYFVSVA